MSTVDARARGLLEGERVLVLLPGGRDSVCLLDVAVPWTYGASADEQMMAT